MPAGSGERFGKEGGKQLVEIAGKPVLTWSAEAFDAVGDIGLIVVVCPEERHEEYLTPRDRPVPVRHARGAWRPPAPAARSRRSRGWSTCPRTSSSWCSHDGARPLVSPEMLIAHTINTVKGNFDADGAVVAHPAVDTLKVVEDGVIVGTPDRRVFWNAQTPQVFRAGIYRRAHAAALSDGFVGTDDSSLIERLGGRVLVVEGTRDNIKLTVPEDYLMLVGGGGRASSREGRTRPVSEWEAMTGAGATGATGSGRSCRGGRGGVRPPAPAHRAGLSTSTRWWRGGKPHPGRGGASRMRSAACWAIRTPTCWRTPIADAVLGAMRARATSASCSPTPIPAYAGADSLVLLSAGRGPGARRWATRSSTSTRVVAAQRAEDRRRIAMHDAGEPGARAGRARSTTWA